MFDGVPEQLHQFIASSRTPLVPLSFSSLHHHHNHGSSNPSNDNNTSIFQAFDSFTSSTNSSPIIQVPLQVQAASFLHPFNQQSQAQKSSHQEDHHKQAARSSDGISLVGMNNNNLEINNERSESCNNPAAAAASWSDDEVLSLLRIRSSLDVNWFPESIWEHVSRKLEELGYKRTAEKCKEKFEEEENRYLSNINYNKSHCRSFNEFFDDVEIYTNNNNDGGDDDDDDENGNKLKKPRDEVVVAEAVEQLQDKELLDGLKDSKEEKRKRKRKVDEEDQFEMLKCFCEDVVKKLVVQQEKMHQKLLEDMVRRDEEKFAREEARKKQEMDRVDKELQVRAHEQAIAGDRQATLIKFLNSFTATSMSSPPPPSKTSSSSDNHQNQNQCFEDRTSSEDHQTSTPHSSPLILPQNANNPSTGTQSAANIEVQKNPSSKNLDHHYPKAKNPNSPNVITSKKPLSPTSVSTPKNAHQNPSTISKTNDRDHDVGKRWPRDEVFALINLRCSLQNNNNGDHHHQDSNKESGGGGGQAAKIPLWERISQGMSELGYKRSAKRCKEKWENINKYFRKTKDANKKRSLDSRTCPYFHQLTTLYNNNNNQATILVPPPSSQEKKAAAAGGNRPTALPENHSTPSSQPGSSTDSSMHAAATAATAAGGHDHQGEKILVLVPTFDFEF